MAKSQSHTSSVSPVQRTNIRRAQRLVVLVLVLTSLALVMEFAAGFWSSGWQGVAGIADALFIIVMMVVILIQLRAGQLERGGWIMIGTIFVAVMICALVISGIGVALGLVLVVGIVLVAEIMLPPAKRGPVSALSVGALLFTLLMDVINLPGRIDSPELQTFLPLMVVPPFLILAYLIVREFSNYSLRSKLIVVSLAVSLTPLLLLGFVFTQNLQQQQLNSVNQSLHAAAEETAAGVDEFIQNGLSNIRVAAQLPDLITLLETPENTPEHAAASSKANAVLRSLSRTDPIYLSSIALLDRLGNTVADTYQVDVGTSKSDRIWFLEAIAQGVPYASSVSFAASNNRPSIYFSAPVRNADGEILGVVRLRYDADVFQELLFHNNGLAGTGSGAILVDDKNIQIANGRDRSNIFKIVGAISPEDLAGLKAARRVPPDQPTEELVLNLPDFARNLAENSPSFVAEMEGEASTVGHESLEQAAIISVKSVPWKVVFNQPQQEFLTPLTQQTRLITLGGVGVVLIIVGLAVLAAQAIARPVIALTDTAQKVSLGDLSARAEANTHDEIGTLAATFNTMTGQIRDLVTSLEDRVQARTRQLEASAEIGRAVTSILDTNQLLNDTVQLISRHFGFYYVAIFTVDAAKSTAVLRAATGEAGRVLLERGHHLPINAESMVGGAIQSNQARIALDVGKGAVRFANPMLPYTRSEIALPMRVGNRSLGALDVQSEQAGAFDQANAAMLQAIADQVAVALLNAETFDRAERQARTLAVLNQLSRELTTARSLEAIAYATANAITNLLGASHAYLARTTVNPDILAVQAISQNANAPLGELVTIALAHTLSEEVMKRGELMYTPDLGQAAASSADANALCAAGARSGVTLPLRAGAQVLGTLLVGNERPAAYTPEQINQLDQVAGLLAVALENLRLAEQTRQSLAEIDAVNRRLMGQAWSDYLHKRGDLTAEWRGGQWIRVSGSKRAATALQVRPEASSMQLPIQVRGEIIGEINVTVDEERTTLDQENIAFAQALVDQVGQILENARLLEETERLAQREKTVASAADKIHRSTEIDGVLHTAVAELNRIIGRRGISIQLGFGSADKKQDPLTNDLVPTQTSSAPGSASGNGRAAEAEGDSQHV